MRVFLSGANGQLGRDTEAALLAAGHTVISSGSRAQYEGNASYCRLDITDRDSVFRALRTFLPQVLIHCAAWTNVDAAEEAENQESVCRVNADGTTHLADACREVRCKMIYISTDYVLSGEGDEPFSPDTAIPAPKNYYGYTKLMGEQAVQTLDRYIILRVSWLYGMNGKNFFRTISALGKCRDSVRVVCDQVGRPTYTKDLARLLTDMADSDANGIYHVSGEGPYVSWYELCKETFRLCGIKAQVIPVSTAEYGVSKALRPKNSRLDTGKLIDAGFVPLPDWQDSLAQYIKEAGL